MAKLLLCLCLLLIRSNAYAWYCSYTPSPEGWVTNLVCNGISNQEALAIAWCPFRPQDPICGTQQPAQPTCTTRTETQSLSCPVHYSGAINQSRSNNCPSEDMGDWVTVSNNCSPDPPTCETSVEEKQVACSDGYTGLITEQRLSSCPDPYGQPIFGQWVEIQNSCVKSLTNVTNVSSPISPVSPINPMMTPDPLPQVEVPMAAPVEMSPAAPLPQTTVSSESTSIQSSPTVSKQEVSSTPVVATPSSETKQDTPKAIEVPKGKDLVPGFGLVMSLDILNKPMQFQQQQLEIALEYTQELPNEFRGNQSFLLQLFTDSVVGDGFDRLVSRSWDNLRRHNDLQPCYSCD